MTIFINHFKYFYRKKMGYKSIRIKLPFSRKKEKDNLSAENEKRMPSISQKTQEFHRTPYITITASEKQTTDPEVLPPTEIPLLSVAEKGIRIDKKNRTAYIDGKILPTTPMTFSIFLLLSENIEKPITRQLIEQELWENADKETEAVVGNRLHQNISKLRKALKDFPQYEIVGGKGKGYKLTLVSTANGTEGT